MNSTHDKQPRSMPGGQAQEQAISNAMHQEQKHGIPTLLSFFIPGLGQIVKGQVIKGFLILSTPLLGVVIFSILRAILVSVFYTDHNDHGTAVGLLIFGIVCYPVFFIWQLIDAYNYNE